MDFPTPLWALILVLSAICMCPTIPACPPIITFLPILVLPLIPDWAAITVLWPISVLCAIWIRLSNFAPSLIIVEPMVARSIVVFAPISTKSSTITLPIWGTFLKLPSFWGAYPNPSPPITVPACMDTLLPMIQSWWIITPGYKIEFSPMVTLLPKYTWG